MPIGGAETGTQRRELGMGMTRRYTEGCPDWKVCYQKAVSIPIHVADPVAARPCWPD